MKCRAFGFNVDIPPYNRLTESRTHGDPFPVNGAARLDLDGFGDMQERLEYGLPQNNIALHQNGYKYLSQAVHLLA